MNVLHLNKFASGGAFIAAKRIHDGLINEGINSQFMVLSKTNDDPSIRTYLNTRSFSRKLIESVKYRFYKSDLTKTNPKSNSIVHLPYSAFDITKSHIVKEADILHLHWIPEMIDFRHFFKKIQKPVIWTHHDDWINNEVHHYEDDKIYENLKGKYFDIKKKALLATNVKFVAPSTWLLKRIKNHHPNCQVVRIAYGIKISDKMREFNDNEQKEDKKT